MKFFYERGRKRKREMKRIRKRDILGLCWFQDIEQKIRFKLSFNWMKKVFFASLTNDKNELKKNISEVIVWNDFFLFSAFQNFPSNKSQFKIQTSVQPDFLLVTFYFKTLERFLIQGWVDFLKRQNSKEWLDWLSGSSTSTKFEW